jgi:type III restriction enzyme
VQTVSDYPLVEAIAPERGQAPRAARCRQPRQAHRAQEPHLQREVRRLPGPGRRGVAQELRRAREAGQEGRALRDGGRHQELRRSGRASAKICPELQGACWSSTPRTTAKSPRLPAARRRRSLELLRKQSNEIDTWKSPYKAIVSVLMLKEGWDVRNVTVIVGLRAYTAKSNILPEQTLGRGLRRMYFGSDQRKPCPSWARPPSWTSSSPSRAKASRFERVPMGGNGGANARLAGGGGRYGRNHHKEHRRPRHRAAQADAPLQSRVQGPGRARPAALGNKPIAVKPFTPEETREIVFKTMLDAEVITPSSSTAAARRLPLRGGLLRPPVAEGPALVGGYDLLYPKVKDFIRDHLFDQPVDLEDPWCCATCPSPRSANCSSTASARHQRPDHPRDRALPASRAHPPARHAALPHQPRGFLQAKKSVFNRIVGEGSADGLELAFAAFLETAPTTCRPLARTTWPWASSSTT